MKKLNIVVGISLFILAEGISESAHCYNTRSVDGMQSPAYLHKMPPYDKKNAYEELVSQGNLLYGKSDFVSAHERYGAALKIHLDARNGGERYVIYRQAICLEKLEHFEQAANYFALLPKTDIPAQYNLALCYLKSKQLEKTKKIVAANRAKSTKEYDFADLGLTFNK